MKSFPVLLAVSMTLFVSAHERKALCDSELAPTPTPSMTTAPAPTTPAPTTPVTTTPAPTTPGPTTPAPSPYGPLYLIDGAQQMHRIATLMSGVCYQIIPCLENMGAIGWDFPLGPTTLTLFAEDGCTGATDVLDANAVARERTSSSSFVATFHDGAADASDITSYSPVCAYTRGWAGPTS